MLGLDLQSNLEEGVKVQENPTPDEAEARMCILLGTGISRLDIINWQSGQAPSRVTVVVIALRFQNTFASLEPHLGQQR